MDKILYIKTSHPLRNDFKIVHKKRLYQVVEYTTAKKVEVRELVNGRMEILAKGRKLIFKEIEKLPVKKGMRLSQRSPVRYLPKNRSFGTFKARSKELSFY